MSRLLTPVERDILCPKNRQTGLTRKIDGESEKWWANLIDENNLGAEHLRVLSRRGRKYELDQAAREMWARLISKKKLSPDDLRESIKKGTVTRIKKNTGDGSAGVATWRTVRMSFDLIRRQVGELWNDWGAEDIAHVRAIIKPIVDFDRTLAAKPQHGGRKQIVGTKRAPESVSQLLRDWRAKNAITQSRAAALLQIPIGTYRDWEQKRRAPRGPTLLSVLRKIY
jgi:hypothetical protein